MSASTELMPLRLFQEAESTNAGWWWLSFADSTRPEGQQFLGGCIVQGLGVATAALNAHMLMINPGGGVLGYPIPETLMEHIPVGHRNKLLTREEAEQVFGAMENAEGPG